MNLDALILEALRFPFFEDTLLNVEERFHRNLEAFMDRLVQEKLIVQKMQHKHDFQTFFDALKREYIENLSLHILNVVSDVELIL